MHVQRGGVVWWRRGCWWGPAAMQAGLFCLGMIKAKDVRRGLREPSSIDTALCYSA